MPFWHTCPAWQQGIVSEQSAPGPTSSWQQMPLSHFTPTPEQDPVQVPPQPSLPPMHLPVQFGTQGAAVVDVVVGATHVPLTQVCPPLQVVTQVPPEHVRHWPLGQTFPQAPQLFRSVFSWTHVPLQQDSPLPQNEAQLPLAALQLRHWLASHGAARQVVPQTLAFGQQAPPISV